MQNYCNQSTGGEGAELSCGGAKIKWGGLTTEVEGLSPPRPSHFNHCPLSFRYATAAARPVIVHNSAIGVVGFNHQATIETVLIARCGIARVRPELWFIMPASVPRTMCGKAFILLMLDVWHERKLRNGFLSGTGRSTRYACEIFRVSQKVSPYWSINISY